MLLHGHEFTLTSDRTSPLSVTRRHSYDLPYTASGLAVRDLSNSSRYDQLQARYSPEWDQDRTDLEIKTRWSANLFDVPLPQPDRTYTWTESEGQHITHGRRSQSSGEDNSVRDTLAFDGGKSGHLLARISSEDMIEVQSSGQPHGQTHRTLERRPSSSILWPEEIVEGLRNLHKHRTRLSFYGQTFREQYEYVKDERNQLAGVVAILLQEVGKAPGSILNTARIQALGQDIARRHAALAQTEADLDTMKDRVAQTERALQSVEADLCSYVISDRTSNDTDLVDDLYGSMFSQSFINTDAASSVDRSESGTQAFQIERTMQPQTSSHALYRLHLDSQYSDRPHVAISTGPVVVGQPNSISDAEPGPKEGKLRPYWDFDPISLTTVRQQQNVCPELNWIGQHHWDNTSPGQMQLNDANLASLLFASPLQIAKRQRDLERLISCAEDVLPKAKAEDSSSDLPVNAGIADQLLYIGRRSWLEFSRFAAYFNEFAREAVSLRALPFEIIDAMLERVSFAKADPGSQALSLSVLDDSSLSSIKLNILTEAVPPKPEQPNDESGKSNPETSAWTTSPEVPMTSSLSIHPTIDNALLTPSTRHASRAHFPRPLSLPADLSKSDLNMIRFPTL